MKGRRMLSPTQCLPVRRLLTVLALLGLAIGAALASEAALPLEVQVRDLGVRGLTTGKGEGLATHVRIEVSLAALVQVDRVRVAVSDLVPAEGNLVEHGRFEPAHVRWTTADGRRLRPANGSLSLEAGETLTAVLDVPMKGAAYRHLTVEAVGQDSIGRTVRGGNRVRVALEVPMPGPFHRDGRTVEYRAVPSKGVSR